MDNQSIISIQLTLCPPVAGTTLPPLKPSTASRLNAIQMALQGIDPDISYHFNLSANHIELTVQDYVFDSSEYNLQFLLSLVDDFMFDALIDGKVNLELVIRDAFEEEEV